VEFAWNMGGTKIAEKSLWEAKTHRAGDGVMLKERHEKDATKVTDRRAIVIHNRS